MLEQSANQDDQRTVLVVDDQPVNLEVIGGLLQPHYRVKVANSGERALRIAESIPQPDLILLDVMMPEMDGYGVLLHLRKHDATRDIPVIFVTAMDADEDEEKGLKLGAVDYITKPIRPAILMARVKNHLELKQARDWLQDQNGYLESEVSRRMRENELIKDVSLQALATLAESRDMETGNHIRRTQRYVELLARKLQTLPKHRDHLTEERIRMISKAAPLHDIGKVGIPDQILRKPGKLTADEWQIMKTHAQIGADAIRDAMTRALSGNEHGQERDQIAKSLPFMEMAEQIASGHHEKWDGSGYPKGLSGDAIPLPARLMALADVFDALSCRRVYKDAFPIEEVDRIIGEGRGTHFDPDLVDAYFDLHVEFVEIAKKFSD